MEEEQTEVKETEEVEEEKEDDTPGLTPGSVGWWLS